MQISLFSAAYVGCSYTGLCGLAMGQNMAIRAAHPKCDGALKAILASIAKSADLAYRPVRYFNLYKQVPKWLFLKEKPLHPNVACAAAMTR